MPAAEPFSGMRGLEAATAPNATEVRRPGTHGFDSNSATALAVFVGYFTGAKLGLALTFLPNPVSVLWPPNAILFAALLLVPPSRWWVVAVAALPAHLLAELQSGIPFSMVGCWFISNFAEAAIGAAMVRKLGALHQPFGKPLHVIGFVFAAFTAALLSSFLDSAFVKWNAWGDADYWDLWAARSLSNAATSLVLVPPIVVFATGGLLVFRRAKQTHLVEALLLLVGLLASALVVFHTQLAESVLPVEIYMPLPFLLWAAYRFGPAGTSATVALVAVVAIVGSGHGTGALGMGTPTENARAVQLFLLFISPTLLCFAAAMDERRRAEASLRQSDRRFHVMLEATRDVVYERDLVSGAMWWSRSALSEFGYDRSATGHGYREWCEMIHPDDRESAMAPLHVALAAGSRQWESEFRLRRADGRHALVSERGFIVRDAEGHPLQMIGRLTDITERRDTDELGQELTHASRLTIMGELAASIAHEINQPMSAILSNVDSAEMLLARSGERDAELSDILADIRADGLRASEVMRHIRGLASKRGADIETFDPNEVVRAVLRLVAPVAKRRGIPVSIALDKVPHVWCDRIHVQQVLLNLIFNAMDAMDETPPAQRELFVEVFRSADGMVQIAVRDRGHGLSVSTQGRIFDSFFTTKRDGMGLGLSIARSLVQSHGGRIWATNNADAGATFRFTLRADRRDRNLPPELE
ncbi:Adaptive-response sensory-kinase SasA [Usitatibacter rugosus]|uniref:histidine kinase n=1 Tax=Usitatibacter rugosus TaxID=2732067 RepID=A0A6M4GUN0_9PROT|nr:MASE1 domain-containing protein [Usitatibacter rugosus]QJR10836.1 Adaptive-response sensory-kinase SasA [Usitatibacter rugosus]